MDWPTGLLFDPVELSHPGLDSLLGHAAGDDVVEDFNLREVLHLRAQTAEQHLGDVLGKTLN